MLVAPTKPDAVMLAGIGGVLTRTPLGCMILDVGDGEETLTQFPYGSTLTADGQGVTLPDQTTVHIGGSISGAGGIGDPGGLKHVPLQCVSATRVLYLQAA
ncbi:hypothetical protein [Microlunatus antarcticus]|uniref:Uncharacterized protein n=1 Tax=Microlunatus antarcticus TaxID=53388 RepID=A0A7W5P6F2_9ACTN|nr:hypothetical protein [Microlunatus antarcticus]MBB3326378.1 hypothetical protein [Microlunatus antarcticus]